MASRMDKYKNQMNSTNSSQSRLSKNQNLYEKLYTNKIFTEFNNADFDNVVDLNKVSNSITAASKSKDTVSTLCIR